MRILQGFRQYWVNAVNDVGLVWNPAERGTTENKAILLFGQGLQDFWGPDKFQVLFQNITINVFSSQPPSGFALERTAK